MRGITQKDKKFLTAETPGWQSGAGSEFAEKMLGAHCRAHQALRVLRDLCGESVFCNLLAKPNGYRDSGGPVDSPPIMRY